MKTAILAALAALSLTVGAASAQAARYHAPGQNFHQNNWMSSDD
jgi:hypothetical protein